jgi:hypothetical protein
MALWISWEPPINLWSLPKALYRLCDRPQGSIVIGSSILVGRLEENTVSLRGIWRALCLHTAPTEIYIHKGVNFGMHHRLCVPQLFIYPNSFTYAIYFVIAFVLEVIYHKLLVHIGEPSFCMLEKINVSFIPHLLGLSLKKIAYSPSLGDICVLSTSSTLK